MIKPSYPFSALSRLHLNSVYDSLGTRSCVEVWPQVENRAIWFIANVKTIQEFAYPSLRVKIEIRSLFKEPSSQSQVLQSANIYKFLRFTVNWSSFFRYKDDAYALIEDLDDNFQALELLK